jgi:hypothetical protein
MLKNFEGPFKIKARVTIFYISAVTCPSKGLLIDITSKRQSLKEPEANFHAVSASDM